MAAPKSTQSIGLRQADIVLALSLATDLGTGRPMEWAIAEREHTLANVGSLIVQYKLGHCEVAVRLADRLGLAPSLRHALWHMGEKWNGTGVPHTRKARRSPLPCAWRCWCAMSNRT